MRRGLKPDINRAAQATAPTSTFLILMEGCPKSQQAAVSDSKAYFL